VWEGIEARREKTKSMKRGKQIDKKKVRMSKETPKEKSVGRQWRLRSDWKRKKERGGEIQ